MLCVIDNIYLINELNRTSIYTQIMLIIVIVILGFLDCCDACDDLNFVLKTFHAVLSRNILITAHL